MTFVEKIKTHILSSDTFFRKSCRLWDNIEKCLGAREEQTTWRLGVAYWTSKPTRVQAQARCRAHTHTLGTPQDKWSASRKGL